MSEQNINIYDSYSEHNPTNWYNWENIKRKATILTRDPVATDDISRGYNLLSMIANKDASPRRIFMCTDPEEGSAVWVDITAGATAGEANTASNSATATGVGEIFKDKNGIDLVFKKIKAGTGVSISNGIDDVTINATAIGEANTASNVNTGIGGVGVFKQKAGVDLEFKGINVGSSKLSIKDEIGTNEIVLDVLESNISMSALNNDGDFVQDDSYVHTDNNYTTTEKDKLQGIATGAQANTVHSVAGKQGNIALNKYDVGLGNLVNSEQVTKTQLVTTIVDSDSVVPTSGAVVDYVSTIIGGGSGDMTKAVYDPTGIELSAFDMENFTESVTNKIFSATERIKLTGIEALAEVNNISDSDATELTGGGSTVLHIHDSYIAKTLFDENSVLIANVDDVPLALTIDDDTFLGKKTGSNISSLTATEARTILNVEDGAKAGATLLQVDSDVNPALDNVVYIVDTTSGDITITLPDPAISTSFVSRIYKKSLVSANKVIITTVSGIANIGDNPTQYIYDEGKGLSVIMSSTSYSIIQDSRGLGNVIGASSSTDNAITRYDGVTGKTIQNSLVTIGDAGEVAGVKHIDLNTASTPTHLEGRLGYDNIYKCPIAFDDKSDSSLQIGQEERTYVYNNTGVIIPNGSIVYINDSNSVPYVTLAKADNPATSDAVGFATTDIAIGGHGKITRGGIVGGLNTAGLTAGESIFLSVTVAGGYQTEEPVSPHCVVHVGHVIHIDGSDGSVFVEIRKMIPDVRDMLRINDGMAYNKPLFTVVNDSGLKLDIESITNGDMDFQIDGVRSTLDCTTGAGVDGKARVSLIAGVDANTPVANYIYATDSNGVATLNASTTLPIGAFSWVGKIVIPDVITWATTGEYVIQRYTESFNNGSRGALSHEREKLRALGAVYISGGTQTLNINTGVSPYSVHLEVSAASVYQLHRQDFPAITTGAYYFGNGVNIYDSVADLNEVLELSDGSPIVDNQRYNLVIWGAVNYSTGDCKLFVNVPNGAYTNDSQAAADRDNTADYSVPDDMKSVAFLIARICLRYDTNAGGQFTPKGDGVYSLLGNPIGSRAGGSGAVASTEFGDSTFRVFDDIDSTKQIALQASAISTSTTRVITMADTDVDLADINLNNTHRSSDGSDHTFINQSVTDDADVDFNSVDVVGNITVGGTVDGVDIATNVLQKTIADAKGDLLVASGNNTITRLAVGTNTHVLTADSSEGTGVKWAAASGGGNVTKVGTPVDNQIGIWTGDGTLEGTSAFIFDTTGLKLSSGYRILTGGNTTADTAIGGITTYHSGGASNASLNHMSSTMSSGLTSVANFRTFFKGGILDINHGGYKASAITDNIAGEIAYQFNGYTRGNDTNSTTSADSVFEVNSHYHNGSDAIGNLVENENLAGFKNHDETKVLFKGDGRIICPDAYYANWGNGTQTQMEAATGMSAGYTWWNTTHSKRFTFDGVMWNVLGETTTFVNKSGITLNEGYCVKINSSTDFAVTTQSSSLDQNMIGLVVQGGDDDDTVVIATSGVWNAYMTISTSRGNYIGAASTSYPGQCEPQSTIGSGRMAVALTATVGAGLISCIFFGGEHY